MTVQERVSRRLLKRWILSQLETHMETSISEIAQALGVTPPPPAPENFWSLINGQDVVPDHLEVPGTKAALFLTTPPGYFVTQDFTTSPTERKFTREIEVDIHVMHVHWGYDSTAWLSVEDLEREAEIELWSDIYAGAVIDVMREHVKCDSTNFTVDFQEQRNAVEFELLPTLQGAEGSVARVTVPWTITQTVLTPR